MEKVAGSNPARLTIKVLKMAQLTAELKAGVTEFQVREAIEDLGEITVVQVTATEVVVEHVENRRDYKLALMDTGLFENVS